ncbi:HigA family addiction module antitoxin [Methylobacterium aquaticum]|uniref:HigA family addiction module antitoxin n=1 Tax=Methylobacterium aquaticum TaxID=270351 RepID=UPI0019327904
MSGNSLLSGLAPTHPGEILREDILPAVGLPKTEIARRLGISRQTLYDLIEERQPVTPAMALRLGRLFGNAPSSGPTSSATMTFAPSKCEWRVNWRPSNRSPPERRSEAQGAERCRPAIRLGDCDERFLKGMVESGRPRSRPRRGPGAAVASRQPIMADVVRRPHLRSDRLGIRSSSPMTTRPRPMAVSTGSRRP